MKRRVVIVIEVDGGDPERLAADLRAWGQEQRFRALVGLSGAHVEKIHAAVVDAPGVGSLVENGDNAQ
jgi:hypothetical protein